MGFHLQSLFVLCPSSSSHNADAVSWPTSLFAAAGKWRPLAGRPGLMEGALQGEEGEGGRQKREGGGGGIGKRKYKEEKETSGAERRWKKCQVSIKDLQSLILQLNIYLYVCCLVFWIQLVRTVQL